MPKISNFVDGINHPQMIDLANWVSHIRCFLPLKSTIQSWEIGTFGVLATVFCSKKINLWESYSHRLSPDQGIILSDKL